MPENNIIIKIFEIVSTQVTMNGDLDISVAKTVMELHNIPNQREMLEDLLICFGIVRQLQKEKEGKL